LRIVDGARGDAGTLNGWTLTVAHDGAGGSVTGLAGSGSQYLVTVSAPQGGTYSLDVIQDSGITDAAGNPLAGAAPTGANHTYTVVADTAAPTVTSIERSDPAEESTSETTLVFEVTFGEDVTGVDAGDFALSPDGGFGQFTRTRAPGLAIPDNAAAVSDAITVPGPGTATSVSVSVDIAHPYIDDLTVELVAPDGTARILHDRSGGNADGIEQTYAPDFGGTGIAGDWTLRVSDGASGDAGTLNGWTLTVAHDGAGGSVTGLAGSGSRYLVTVSAPQGGTYNLDVVQDSGITDAAGNPLSDTAPTGPDHTYARTGP
jgi:subtilisin-like proprotein convertase family protein